MIFSCRQAILNSDENRDKGSREIIDSYIPAIESYGSYVKPAFQTVGKFVLLHCHIPSCCLDYIPLFQGIDSFFRLSLNGIRPTLHFYKMDSVSGQGNDVNFLSSASPVPFQNSMPPGNQIAANLILPSLPEFPLRIHDLLKFLFRTESQSICIRQNLAFRCRLSVPCTACRLSDR